MKKEHKNLTVLGVAAHPDDLEFGASGTFIKWVRQGASCYYLICTDGSKGSDDPKMTTERLIKTRQEEQKAAGEIIGLKDVFFLDYPDTELSPNLDLKRDIVRYIRMLRPDIVVALDPTIFYSTTRNFINHTDHRAAGNATMDAVFPLARDRLTFPEHEAEGFTPHKVKQIYFVNFENYNEVVDISETFGTKIKALAAHKSQIKADAIDWVRQRSETLAKKHGFKHAESFIKITLK